MVAKKKYQLILPVIGLVLLLGVMVFVVHFGVEMLSANRLHRETVVKWIDLKQHALHDLEDYLDSGDAHEYEHFQKQYHLLKQSAEVSQPLLDPSMPIDSVTTRLLNVSNLTRKEASNVIFYARQLSRFSPYQQSILAWLNMSQQIFALEEFHKTIHHFVENSDLERDPDTYDRLKSKLQLFTLMSNRYEKDMMDGLEQTTTWLEGFIRKAAVIISFILLFCGGALVYYIYRRSSFHEEKYRQLFTNAEMAIVFLDERSKVVKVNRSFTELFGYTQSKIKGKDLDKLIAPEEKLEEARQITRQTREGKTPTHTTWRETRDGERIDLIIGASPVIIDGKLRGMFGLYYNISEMVQMQDQLKESLDEKKVLIQEIHHRVKNNLAVIAGLLQLQIDSVESPEMQTILRDSQSRIYSIAMIHELLYQEESFSQIAFKEYIEKLIDHLKSTYLPERSNISINLEAMDITMNINQAIPCGLIINELATNALEHAFEPGEQGSVDILIEEEQNHIKLIVQDDGKGMKPDTRSSTSIGLSIVENLAAQLEGEIDFSTNSENKGTRVVLSFEQETFAPLS